MRASSASTGPKIDHRADKPFICISNLHQNQRASQIAANTEAMRSSGTALQPKKVAVT